MEAFRLFLLSKLRVGTTTPPRKPRPVWASGSRSDCSDCSGQVPMIQPSKIDPPPPNLRTALMRSRQSFSVIGRGEASKLGSFRPHPRANDVADGPACRLVPGLHGRPRNDHQRGRDGGSGHSFGKTFRRVFYVARIALQAPPPPALKMTMGCIFRILQPLTFQNCVEHSEHRNKTRQTQLQQGFRAFRRFRNFGVCSECSDRNRALLPHF